MKLHVSAFALALCFAGSFAFADNPTDAPLTDSTATIVAQAETPTAQVRSRQKKNANCSSEKIAKKSGAESQAAKPNNSGETHTYMSPSL